MYVTLKAVHLNRAGGASPQKPAFGVDQIDRLAIERAIGRKAEWLAPVFAEIVGPGATLAIGAKETVALWKEGNGEPGANRTAYLEFQVEDIDAEFERLRNKVQLVHEMKTMPWGNRTFQFRDPEGNAVSFYMPETAAAKKRFSAR